MQKRTLLSTVLIALSAIVTGISQLSMKETIKDEVSNQLDAKFNVVGVYDDEDDSETKDE